MTLEHEPMDPLDQNLERLLKVAPTRERMTGPAKERLAARLRERRPEPESAAPPSKGPWKWRIAVAAAAAVLLFFGLEAAWNAASTEESVDPERVAGKDEHPLKDDALPQGPDGETLAPGTLALGPGRAPVGVAPEGTTSPGVAVPDRSAPGPLVVAGLVRLDDSIKTPPAAVTVWVRPMVPLPRVADAVRHDLPWGLPGEGGRSLPFALEGALASARKMGASRVLVHVAASTAGSASSIHTLTDGPLEGVALTLFAQETAIGYVVDSESQAGVAGAVVIAVDQIPFDALDVHPEKQGQLPSVHAVTDASGKFTLTGLRRTPTVRLRASAPGYGPGWETLLATGNAVETGAPRFEGAIELSPGGRVFGVVERKDGTRWAQAVVIVSRQDFDPATITRPVLTYGSAVTDADGRFEVLDLPGGLYVTLLMGDMQSGSNVSPQAFELTRVKVGRDTEINFMSVQASAGGALRGVLRNAEGDPLSGRSLTISLVNTGSQEDGGWRATTTAEDGSFSFADLEPGDYSMLHTLGGFREKAGIWSGTIDGPTQVDLRLPTGAVNLKGAPPSGTWPPGSTETGAWAMVERFDGATGAWNFAGSGFQAPGTTVAIRHLLPGRYRATFLCDAPGLGFAEAGPFDVLDSPVEVSVRVPAGDTLFVRAVGPAGEPVSGVSVAVWPSANSPWAGRQLPQQAVPITGPDGLVQLRGVPFGEVEIRLRRKGQPAGSRLLEYRQGGSGDEQNPATVTSTGR